jgi:quinol monooxygenase YgiN
VIKVKVDNFVKAECVEEYLAIVKELVEKTNIADAGCVRYELCRDASDPLHFIMLEEWENQEALDAHMKSPHFTGLVPKMDGYTSKPPEITPLIKVF